MNKDCLSVIVSQEKPIKFITLKKVIDEVIDTTDTTTLDNENDDEMNIEEKENE